jgi:hypothetical protein
MSRAGDEFLRAVMEQNGVYSNPALYCVPLNSSSVSAAADGITFSGRLQCKADRYFLMMGMVPTGTQSPGFQRIDQSEYVRIFDPVNNNNFSFSPFDMQTSLFSESALAFSFTFPTYALWEPKSLIGVEWKGHRFQSPPHQFKFVTLVGIEYGMKSPGSS